MSPIQQTRDFNNLLEQLLNFNQRERQTPEYTQKPAGWFM